MSDVEVEFASEDDEVGSDLDVGSFGEAVLWGTDWTVETILAQLRRGNIELNPRFQRRDAWSRSTKSRFIESVILGLPVPQIVLAESKDQRGKYIILDGKQRLLSLMQYAGLSEGPSNSFSLSGLDVRTDLLRKRYRHLESDPHLRSDLDAFNTHTVRTTVIRGWPSISFLHVVFQRLNTGSLKLSPQELRQAIAPGPFTDFADDFTLENNAASRLLGRTSLDPRMRDVELLVRAISFRIRITEYSGRMKEFLDSSCMSFNDNWETLGSRVHDTARDFSSGVQALEEIFGPGNVARKLYSSLFNRSIFDALIYFAMDNDIRDRMIKNAPAVREAYEHTVRDPEFQESVESDTAGIPHTAKRLHIWGQKLSLALHADISVPVTAENDLGQLRFAF